MGPLRPGLNSFAIVCLLFIASTNSVQAECDYVTLVKCFIEVLDDWAWTLYETKDNVVTVSDEGCEHFKTIRNCITDNNDAKHGCNQAEVIEASRTVSDLLTHRKHSGTFLKSYYLLDYACGDGREEVNKHKECLKSEMIGQQTLSAAGYLEEKFRETRPATAGDACSLLTQKLIKFRQIIAEQNLCNGEAEKLMCESLRRMFVNVEADLLTDCPFNCNSDTGVVTSEATATEVTAVLDANGGTAAARGNGTNGAVVVGPSLLSTALVLVVAAILRF